MKNLVSRMTMVALAASGCAACSSEDRGPPALVAAQFLDTAGRDPITLGVLTDPSTAADEASAETPTLGTVKLVFSELLDGDSVVELTYDSATGDVTGFIGRQGIVRIAPVDGTLIDSTVAYIPSDVAILADAATYLPAESLILVNVMGDRVRDKAGNLLPIAADKTTGEPYRDADGRGIGASTAFFTAAVAVTGTVIPEYGLPDDPDTADVDETVGYDAAVQIGFNTAMDAASFVDLVRFLPVDANGDPSGPVIAGIPSGGLNLDSGLPDSTFVAVTPATPLAPTQGYELHIAPGGTDMYGVAYAGPITVEAFSTL